MPDTVLGSEATGINRQPSPHRSCKPSRSIYFKRVKAQAKLGTERKYLKIIHLTKDLYPTYKELSNLTLRKQLDFKLGRRPAQTPH